MKIALKYAAFIVLAGFAWLCLEFLIGLHGPYLQYNGVIRWFYFAVPIVFTWYAVKEAFAASGDRLTMGQTFGIAFATGAAAVVIAPLYQWAFFTWINPDYFPTMISAAVERGIPESTSRAVFNFTAYAVQRVVFGLVFSAVTALVFALIYRRR